MVSPDGRSIADERDSQTKPCYDQSALMRHYDIIREICDAMLELGWGPYQNDHEDANGQFEMNWQYADCLVTADRHVFFKYMAKSIAEKHGLRATFMPKPFADLTGNGCHCHVSLWNKAGKKKSVPRPRRRPRTVAACLQFSWRNSAFGGRPLRHLQPGRQQLQTYQWRRHAVGARRGHQTQFRTPETTGTHLVRIPDSDRFELRLMDGAANPYLLQAGVLAAGLDGVAGKRDPGKRLDINMVH